jgi:hypothetical protein
MPYGSGPAIRLALVHAKPWQRYLICIVMIAGGIGLALLGHVAGLVLAGAGGLLGWRMVQYRLRSKRTVGARTDDLGSPRPFDGGSP